MDEKAQYRCWETIILPSHELVLKLIWTIKAKRTPQRDRVQGTKGAGATLTEGRGLTVQRETALHTAVCGDGGACEGASGTRGERLGRRRFRSPHCFKQPGSTLSVSHIGDFA